MSEARVAEKPWPVISIADAHALLTGPGSPFEMEEQIIHGIAQRVWKNAPPTLRDAFLRGRVHGDKEYLVYENERVTFEGFARAAITLAHALIAEGIEPGDRVVLAMRNLPEWPVAFFAGVLAGAIVTPLNAWWTSGELEYALVDSGARLAIVDAERLERIRDSFARCPKLERVIVSRHEDVGADPSIIHLESILGRVEHWRDLPDRPLPDRLAAPDDDVTILYTSGTTGEPKGAVGSHRNATTTIVTTAFSSCRALLRRGEALPEPTAEQAQKIVLIAIPLFHTTGCHSICIPGLVMGTKIVMMRRWNPELAMQIIQREKVTHAGGVPTIAWQLIESDVRHNYDLSSLESVTYGGAPAAAELVRRIGSTWPRSHSGLGWGMTETSSTFTANLAEDYSNRPESSGAAVPVCDMRIVDDQGRDLPAGEVGELWAKGPNVVRGYWNKLEATAQTFVDGWLKTGDLARIDEEGFLFIIDRKKDMLIRGGENIYCTEVESVLYEHPAVMDAALVGIPHRTLGEEPGAVVTLKPDAETSEADLKAFVAARLAAFKVPVKILIRRETLPRNANGKIMKPELKKLFI